MTEDSDTVVDSRDDSGRAGSPQGAVSDGAGRNEVILCGRVSILADERSLPSGDAIMTTRIVVDRGATRRGVPGAGRSRQRVDAIDCVAWTAKVRQTIRRWQPGDEVFVRGAIRRRFYRTDRGVVSRVEVEVTEARRLATVDVPGHPVRSRRRGHA